MARPSRWRRSRAGDHVGEVVGPPLEPAPPDVRKWTIFAVMSIALFMSALDSTIVATGLPTIRHALHTGLNWASWTITGYQLGLVLAMPLAGRVADSIGRKQVFLAAAVMFTASSLLCGLAPDIGLLVALRLVQAAGGAAFMPAATGIVIDIFGKRSNRVLGMFSSIFPLGAVVGPIAGGVIISAWSWRGMFLLNVPLGVVFTLLAWRLFPSSRPQGGRADVLGATLFGGGILGLMLAITDAGSRSVSLASARCTVPLALGVCCFWLFLRHCARSANPLVPLYLLKGRVFRAINTINLFWGACAIGFVSLVPLFAQERFGFSPLDSGTLLTARAVGQIVLAMVASVLIDRTGYRVPIVIGIGLIAAGLVMVAAPPQLMSPYVWLAVGSTVTGLGTGLSAPAANNAVIDMAPNDVGAISGLRGAVRQGGAIIGISMATSIASRSGEGGHALAECFFVVAVLLVCTAPLALLIPARMVGEGAFPGATAGPPPVTTRRRASPSSVAEG
jgi:EmrB/QacA subfamily drug resistance transporter